jgi:hypothetical protein
VSVGPPPIPAEAFAESVAALLAASDPMSPVSVPPPPDPPSPDPPLPDPPLFKDLIPPGLYWVYRLS